MSAPASYAARFAALLDAQSIAYAVTGPAGLRPQDLDDDVDIVVPADAVPQMGRLVSRFCEEQHGLLVNVLEHALGARCFVCAWSGGDTLACLRLDISGDCILGGRRLLLADEILDGRVRDAAGNAWVPAPAREFVYLLVKKVDQQALNHRTAAHLTAQWRRDPAGAGAQAARFWAGPDLELVARAADTGDWHWVRARLPGLRRALRSRIPGHVRHRTADLARVWRRLFDPTGLVVALLGPDGSGKTTVIERCVPRLAPVFRRTQCHHFKPNVFGLTLPGPAGSGRTMQGPRPGWSLIPLAKLAYYLFDYWVGYAWKVWPRVVRSALVVFDRYFDDLGIDPVRLRRRGPMALAKRLSGLLPQPGLCILLDAPPAITQARKREVPPDETARQRAAFLTLVRGRGAAQVVDGSQPLDEVVTDVERIILNHMARRTARRLGVAPATRSTDRRAAVQSPWIAESASQSAE